MWVAVSVQAKKAGVRYLELGELERLADLFLDHDDRRRWVAGPGATFLALELVTPVKGPAGPLLARRTHSQTNHQGILPTAATPSSPSMTVCQTTNRARSRRDVSLALNTPAPLRTRVR